MIHITYDTDDNEVKEKSDPLAVNLKMCPFKMDLIWIGGLLFQVHLDISSRCKYGNNNC